MTALSKGNVELVKLFLAAGMDPTMGQPLASIAPLQSPDVVRALFLAATMCAGLPAQTALAQVRLPALGEAAGGGARRRAPDLPGQPGAGLLVGRRLAAGLIHSPSPDDV